MTAEEFRDTYQGLPVAFLLATRHGVIEAANDRCNELLDARGRQLTGASIESLVCDEAGKVRRYLTLWSGSREFLPGALRFRASANIIDVRVNGSSAGAGSGQVLLHLTSRAETHRPFTALNEKIDQLAVEIEERRRTESLILAQNDALGMIATLAPLSDVLQRVARMLSGCGSSNMGALVMLADERRTFRTGASSGLPEEWSRAVTLAAPQLFTEEPLLSSDIGLDARWSGLQSVAQRYDLRSCWAFPVLSGAGELLGIASLYGRSPGAPSERDWRLSRIATSTIATAIERHRTDERIAGILQRQAMMLDGLPAAIALVDSAGCIRSVNSAWVEWLLEANLTASRSGPGEDLLSSFDEVFGRPVVDAIREVMAGHSGRFDGECEWRERDTPRWARLTVAPVGSGGSPRDIILMHVDITDRKLAENHLLSQAAELTRANAELQQFAYVASHDLREPLRTVKSFSQLLVRRFDGIVAPDTSQFLRYVTEGVTRMEDLIDDLLLYSRVAHGDVEDRSGPVALNDVVAAAIRNLDSSIADSGARISVGELPQVVGDRVQLIQLFQNLINNAIKYKGPEPPLIEVAATEAEGGPVIRVSDNGIGIAKEYQETIFGLFKRLHPRNVPGTGIGLALCRKIAEAHGGSVWVQSEPGCGSTFQVLLPNRAGQAQTS